MRSRQGRNMSQQLLRHRAPRALRFGSALHRTTRLSSHLPGNVCQVCTPWLPTTWALHVYLTRRLRLQQCDVLLVHIETDERWGSHSHLEVRTPESPRWYRFEWSFVTHKPDKYTREAKILTACFLYHVLWLGWQRWVRTVLGLCKSPPMHTLDFILCEGFAWRTWAF